MAPVQWSDLPPGIVDVIAKLLKSDIDLLRLRSVCSSWRSAAIPRPRKPFSLPLKVPPVCNPPELRVFDGTEAYYTLQENTLCRLSPSINYNQVVDASNDWMIKVSKKSSNVYSLLKPLSTEKIDYPPGTFPNCLNLLDCRIAEICKSYRLNASYQEGLRRSMVFFPDTVKKVIILFDYMLDCEFVALALHDEMMSYWKLGDEKWTPIDTKGYKIHDVILHNGKCYAVDSLGMLVSFDCKMQLTVVTSSPSTYRDGQENLLVECKSDLYLVSKAYRFRPGHYRDLISQKKTTMDLALVDLVVNKFNKCDSNWGCVENLEDNVFLLGKDASVGVSTKDFEGFKGNSVYLMDHWCFIEESRSELYGHLAGIYHLDNPKALRVKSDEDSRKLNLRPPTWLMHSASSPEL